MVREADFELYKILGVARDAQPGEIKAAYRHLVRLHHPDANPERREDAEIIMKRVVEAYSILGDDQKRARYESECRLRQFERPQNAAGAPPKTTGLLGQMREALELNLPDLAARLGMAPAQLGELEARDAIPQTPVQLRTFALLCEQAAQKLESRGRSTDAHDLRAQLTSKRARQAIFR